MIVRIGLDRHIRFIHGERTVNRRPSTLEQYIGERIRRRRTRIGLTQEELAAALGCSYQQIQKYESGANRISAGNLLRLARRLDVPIDYFFLGWEEHPAGEGESEQSRASRHTADLIRSFEAVEDPGVRAAMAALARAVADRVLRRPVRAGRDSDRNATANGASR